MVCKRLALVAIAFVGVCTQVTLGQGPYVTGVGPVNRAMGGAGTAAPLDAIGALNWNPASISGLATDEVSFGLEFLHADVRLDSTAGPGTSGEAGAIAIPTVGWAHHVEDTPITIGLGLFGNAGFKNNMPAGNAILSGAPAFAAAEFLQLTPTISYVVNDRLSIGFAPTVTVGELSFDPLGPSVVTPAATAGQGNRLHWGGGFQAGVYYITDQNFHLGLMFRSPQWMEKFRFFSPTGTVTFDMDLPMILSLGTAYSGWEGWTLAADFRYFGFDDADGFSEMGWSNVFAAAFGVQRQVTDRVFLRFGGNFNQPPIRSGDVALNVMTPLIQKYNISVGGSYRIAKCVDLNAAYVYLGDNDVTGPVAGGAFSVTNNIQAHSAVMGVTVRY